MTETKAPQFPDMKVGERRSCAVSFVGVLNGTHKLVSTDLAISSSPSGLTITEAAISTAIETINGKEVAIAKAVTFMTSAIGAGATLYTITITAKDDTTPTPQIIKRDVDVEVLP